MCLLKRNNRWDFLLLIYHIRNQKKAAINEIEQLDRYPYKL
jgi:hypothetical protein